MSKLGRFEEFRGQTIKIAGCSNTYYVPKAEEAEMMLEEVTENMAFEDKVAEGWQVVALDGCFEMGECVQADGLLAIHAESKQVMTCDEVTNEILAASLDDCVIENQGSGYPE